VTTEKATFLDLTGHKTGVPRNDILWLAYPNITREEAMNRIQYFPPNFDLRTRFEYNNWMWGLTGYILENIEKTSWENIVHDKIFVPLGMSTTTADVYQAIKTGNYAFPVTNYKGKIVPLPKDINKIISVCAPAGAISSNAVDMAKWMRFQLNNGKVGSKQLVSAENLIFTHKPQFSLGTTSIFYKPFFPVCYQESDYGMGWMESVYNNRRITWHSGGTIGHITLLWLFPYDKVGIFMSGTGDSNKIGTLQILAAMYASDLIFKEQPWLNQESACKFPCTFIPCEDEIRNKSPISTSIPSTKSNNFIYKFKDSLPLSDYVGTYFNAGYGNIIITLVTNTLHMKYYDITGTLHPTTDENHFRPILEGAYELLYDSADNPLPPLIFTTSGTKINGLYSVPFEQNYPPYFIKK